MFGFTVHVFIYIGWWPQDINVRYLVNNFLSNPQLNHNSTQPNITLSWVRHANDFAYHPTTHPLQKLNVFNISAVADRILIKL